MRYVVVLIAVVFLCSAVFIGAINNIPYSHFNNRPYTLHELVSELSQLDYGMDNLHKMLEQIDKIWNTDWENDWSSRSTRVVVGGSGGTFPDKDEVDNYDIDLEEWFNSFLKALQTIASVCVYLVTSVTDLLKLVGQILSLVIKIIVGKPIAV